jgi:uncharacterized protein (DUF1330 family)
MPAYCFFDVREIVDAEKLADYRAQVFTTVHRYDGRYLALGGPFEVVEGDWRPVIPVIIVFPTLARAKDWYDSAEYAPLKALRLDGARTCGVFIEGYDDQRAG